MPDKYYFINVGCADCTVLLLGDKVVMVDCHQGNTEDSEEDILDFIPNKKVDVLILTHQHYDHFDGIQTLINNKIEVSEIWESCYQRRHGDNSVKYDEWKDYIKLTLALNAKFYQPVRSSDDFDVVGGAHFQFLNPPEDINDNDTRKLHDASLVFVMRKGNDSILFTGDASDSALEDVFNTFKLKKKHILHASHHGSINGANLNFIKSVNPNYTIISTKSGVYKNVPHPRALQRYKLYTVKKVRRTDVDGTRVFE